jgi:hypothetical protein
MKNKLQEKLHFFLSKLLKKKTNIKCSKKKKSQSISFSCTSFHHMGSLDAYQINMLGCEFQSTLFQQIIGCVQHPRVYPIEFEVSLATGRQKKKKQFFFKYKPWCFKIYQRTLFLFFFSFF